MAIYLQWHVCPCHEPFVAQIYICSNTLGQVEHILYTPVASEINKSYKSNLKL